MGFLMLALHWRACEQPFAMHFSNSESTFIMATAYCDTELYDRVFCTYWLRMLEWSCVKIWVQIHSVESNDSSLTSDLTGRAVFLGRNRSFGEEMA